MVISNGLADDTELHYTHSLHPKEPFLVIRAKKRKNASESPVVRASILTYNHHLWYALFPLLRKCFKKAPNLGAFQKKYEVKSNKGGFTTLKIHVCDAVMGSGKTQAAITMMIGDSYSSPSFLTSVGVLKRLALSDDLSNPRMSAKVS